MHLGDKIFSNKYISFALFVLRKYCLVVLLAAGCDTVTDRQVSIGILSSHFNTTIRSRSPSETGGAGSHGLLDRIGYYLVAASGVTLSHSGTGKQEQTTFTERKRQGNMQDPEIGICVSLNTYS